jgi:hypothetical protein
MARKRGRTDLALERHDGVGLAHAFFQARSEVTSLALPPTPEGGLAPSWL